MPCPGVMISCFDESTIMATPWAEAGYLCYCVDIKHPPGETRQGNIIKVGADLMGWLPPRMPIVFAAFFPPCTDVAVSGARWFQDKGLGGLCYALRLFDQSVKLAEWTGALYLIENPVSTVSTYWRKPDYTFDPCDYGDAYQKKKRAYGLGADLSCQLKTELNLSGSVLKAHGFKNSVVSRKGQRPCEARLPRDLPEPFSQPTAQASKTERKQTRFPCRS